MIQKSPGLRDYMHNPTILIFSYRLLLKLNLPGSLDALDKPAGVPPSLLRRSEEIRSMGGVDSLQHHVDEVQALGTSASGILEEACSA